jgi:hypothetical protein
VTGVNLIILKSSFFTGSLKQQSLHLTYFISIIKKTSQPFFLLVPQIPPGYLFLPYLPE